MPDPQFVIYQPDKKLLSCQDKWTITHLKKVQQEIKQLKSIKSTSLTIDGANITEMDSAGAWILINMAKSNPKIQFKNFSEPRQNLLSLIEKEIIPAEKIPHPEQPNFLAKVGKSAIARIKHSTEFLNFIGYLSFEFLRNFIRPTHWRFRSLIHVIDTSGYRALPIIALLSLMIGIVISYQLGIQLRNYGAGVFMVNLLGLSILREFGPLITAIMVAGRTGSAFTAELGIMKLNQEIDALNTMGVTPAELLLVPRIIGLVIALPLITLWADAFGVFGGMIMTKTMLDISFYDFLNRFQHEIPVRALFIGLGKAPVFALIIASIACFQGMKVESNAESVGLLTTKSVVLSIFFIIVADAIFSILFSWFNL